MRYLGALRYFLLNSCESEKNGEVYYLTRIKSIGSFWKSLISIDWEWGWINFWREIGVNLFNNPRDKLWWGWDWMKWNILLCFVFPSMSFVFDFMYVDGMVKGSRTLYLILSFSLSFCFISLFEFVFSLDMVYILWWITRFVLCLNLLVLFWVYYGWCGICMTCLHGYWCWYWCMITSIVNDEVMMDALDGDDEYWWWSMRMWYCKYEGTRVVEAAQKLNFFFSPVFIL